MKTPIDVKCLCGRTVKTMQETLPMLVEVDEDKDLIFMICGHGVVLFDKKSLEKRRN
jgi:hypothetical protein